MEKIILLVNKLETQGATLMNSSLNKEILLRCIADSVFQNAVDEI